MPELVFVLILVLLVIVFAISGFFHFLKHLLGGSGRDREPGSVSTPKPSRSLRDDVLGTSFLLDHLRRRDRINEKTYQRLQSFLEAEFSDEYELTDRMVTVREISPEPTQVPTLIIDDQGNLHEVEAEIDSSTVPEVVPPPVVTAAESNLPENQATVFEPSLADQQPPPAFMPSTPVPRRSFNEVMAGFMLEKNIRWGELASGILIVGSALGLVVSLRNEMRDTIPYFSALLFMLITAAIHGAGIYTLKKWKLRTTSRGTLLIGLLLIPLNFLAACILTGNVADRRELTDPLLWIAIAIGLSSFGAMIWYSGKCLFRRGQLPMVIAILGCGIGTLVINRVGGLDESSLRKLLVTVPLSLSFLIGTATFYRRQWCRLRWTERATNRLFVFLGISAFAFFVAASLLFVRAELKSAAVVALMPAFSMVCLMTTWLGRIVWRGAAGEEQQRLSLTGLTLHILGLGLMAVSLFVSVSNPTVLLINAAIATAGLMLFAKHQKEARLLPAAWAAFAVFVVCGVNLYTGKLNWDVWASGKELFDALVCGQSGLSLLVAGVAVAGFHTLYGKRAQDQSNFMLVGWISGAATFLVGCALALIASFVNRSNTFDVMTATALLGVASFISLAVCVRTSAASTKTDSFDRSKLFRYLPHSAAVLTLGFLAHAISWNLSLQNWLNETTFGINANWVLIFAAHSIILAVVGAVCRIRSSPSQLSTSADSNVIADLLGEWSSVTNAMGFIGIFLLVGYQTGLATGIALALSAAWLLLTWANANHRFGTRYWTSLFTAATGLTVVVFVAELLTRNDWCPGIEMPRHWLIQCLALSIWASVWFVLAGTAKRMDGLRKFVDFHPTVEWVTVHVLVIAAASIIGVAVMVGTTSELFREAGAADFTLSSDKPWVFAAMGGIGLALLLAVFARPTLVTGIAMVTVWMFAWSFGAEYFAASKSVGSALRWLLPIGGAIGAAMVASRKPFRPAWAAARNRLGMGGKSTWPARTTQQLIDFALAFVAFIVLTISTIAISQVLVKGGADALGGPLSGSWFGDLPKDVSYGIPIGIMVGTFLLYAISEKRKWLATAGSAVFQYCVILAVFLLFISPHPKLATSWFVNILQAVSVGMTGYGFVWLCFRERIEGRHAAMSGQETPIPRVSQIEVHTLINGFLITSLAVLVMGRFYVIPDQAGDWINTVGGTLGVVAWALYGALAFSVWRKQLTQPHRTSTWMWLACWLGLVLVAMVVALVDRRYAATESTVPWLTFNLIMWGAVLVCISQVILLWLERRPDWIPGVYSERSLHRFKSLRSDQTFPLLFAGAIVLAFAVRGILLNSGAAWNYFAAIGLSIGFLVVAGMLRQSAIISFIAAAVTTLAAILLVNVDPSGWFSGSQPYYANVLAIALTLLALVWSGFYVYRRLIKNEEVRDSYVWMPNLVLLFSSLWVLLGGIGQWIIETGGGLTASSLNNVWGAGAITGPVLLLTLHTWNDRRRFQVISCCLWLVGVVIFGLAIMIPENEMRNASILMGLGLVVTVCGLVWANRDSCFAMAGKLHAPALIRLERSMDRQLPIIGLFLGAIVLICAFLSSPLVDGRAERYLYAMSPFAVAAGLGCMSNKGSRRWLQLVTLSLVTLGAIVVALADLSPSDIRNQPMRLFVRALLVLAGAMFVYGGLVSRWVRENDSWLKSLREMTVATCILALPCLTIVIWQEVLKFHPDTGCGMPIPEVIAVAAVVLGMIVGLIVIAVLPKNDPFSLSLNGRMAYVYVAQVVAAMLLVHLYLTMPWLFQFGMREYWPYIAMLLCFGGVGVAQVLEKRDLTVLGQPLFNTAAVIPVIVAASIWIIDSRADASLVMLTVGLAYLMIGYTHNSILSGAASVVFGNLALWLYYNKFNGFEFVEHPQLWLIPPALSTLVASQINKSSFTRQQLAMIRYICVTVLYLSSTSEIFITGFGEHLWPPMVLALLAVGGIMAGMMFHIRAYLYLGFVFLLMAMISMVSHAHQRFEHVWPWWAFGVGLGVAILVMFGLFEKRKSDIQAIAGRLNEWDL